MILVCTGALYNLFPPWKRTSLGSTQVGNQKKLKPNQTLKTSNNTAGSSNHYLVWFGLVCLHLSLLHLYFRSSLWQKLRVDRHKKLLNTSTNIYAQSFKLLFNKRCSQENHQEIYARAGTKKYASETSLGVWIFRRCIFKNKVPEKIYNIPLFLITSAPQQAGWSPEEHTGDFLQ